MIEYIEDTLPQENPSASGLHANAGIGYRLREAQRFREQLKSLQPRSAGGVLEEKANIVPSLPSTPYVATVTPVCSITLFVHSQSELRFPVRASKPPGALGV